MTNTHKVPENQRAAVNLAVGHVRQMVRRVDWVARECGVDPGKLLCAGLLIALRESDRLTDLKEWIGRDLE